MRQVKFERPNQVQKPHMDYLKALIRKWSCRQVEQLTILVQILVGQTKMHEISSMCFIISISLARLYSTHILPM
jgi:hypothetical protein